MKTKAVIFDYDGVIVDSLDVVQVIYKEIAKHFNNPIFADMKKNIDFCDVDWRKTLKNVGITERKDIDKIKKIYIEEFNKHKELTKLVPDIKEVLEILKKNYKLAVASNNFKPEIEKILKKFNILHYFDVVIGGEKEILKPDPTILIECMQTLNVKPEETVYIGDMDGDITAGRNANVKKVIAVTYGYHSHDKLKQLNPDIIVHNTKDLLNVIE